MLELLRSVFGTPRAAQRAQSLLVDSQPVTIVSPQDSAQAYDIPVLNSRVLWIHDELVNIYGNGTVMNTDKVVQQLQERGITVYQDMIEKDTHIAACDRRLRIGAARKPFQVMPADNSLQAKEDALFVEKVFSDCSIKDILKEMNKAACKGFRLGELIWKPFQWKGKTKLTIDKLIGISEQGVVFDVKWRPCILTAGDLMSGIRVTDPLKHLFMRCGDGAYGDPLLKYAYSTYWFKIAEMKFVLRFMEKYVDPPIIGKYGAGVSREDMISFLEQLASQSISAFPEGLEIPQLLQPDKQIFDFMSLLQYWDDALSKIILGGTRQNSASNAPGAYSATEIHAEQQDDYFDDLAEQGIGLLNRSLIPAIIFINFGARESYPTVVLGGKKQTNPKDFAAIIASLFHAKVPLPLSRRDLYEKLQVTPPDNPEDAIIPGIHTMADLTPTS